MLETFKKCQDNLVFFIQKGEIIFILRFFLRKTPSFLGSFDSSRYKVVIKSSESAEIQLFSTPLSMHTPFYHAFLINFIHFLL